MTPTKTALNALDYIQNDWQQKDGRDVFNEQCEDIRKALTANTWQTMDSAPCDGTKLLLAKYVGHPDHETACWWIVKGFFNVGRGWCDDVDIISDPTHWQLLPIPPKPEQPPC